MIDMARVARNPRFGVSATAPVAFWGYSEGGFAAGSAAELAASCLLYTSDAADE